MTTIGVRHESPLHAALKHWYAQPGDVLEAPVAGYIVDIQRGTHLLEVQTGHFAAIRRKVRTLSQQYRVTLIYPVARARWLVKLPPTVQGQLVRRKSPRRQRLDDLFQELVSFPDLLACPNFSLEIAVIDTEDLLCVAPRAGSGRRGWVVRARRLLRVRARHVIAAPADLWSLLPADLPELFDTADLARVLHRPRWFAQKVAYCLRQSGASTPIGKAGNALVYARTPAL